MFERVLQSTFYGAGSQTDSLFVILKHELSFKANRECVRIFLGCVLLRIVIFLEARFEFFKFCR